MPKLFFRLIALLLVPCLIADPVAAATATPTVWRAVTAPTAFSIAFTRQALTLRMTNFWHGQNAAAVTEVKALDLQDPFWIREKFGILRQGSGMTQLMPHELRHMSGGRHQHPLGISTPPKRTLTKAQSAQLRRLQRFNKVNTARKQKKWAPLLNKVLRYLSHLNKKHGLSNKRIAQETAKDGQRAVDHVTIHNLRNGDSHGSPPILNRLVAAYRQYTSPAAAEERRQSIKKYQNRLEKAQLRLQYFHDMLFWSDKTLAAWTKTRNEPVPMSHMVIFKIRTGRFEGLPQTLDRVEDLIQRLKSSGHINRRKEEISRYREMALPQHLWKKSKDFIRSYFKKHQLRERKKLQAEEKRRIAAEKLRNEKERLLKEFTLPSKWMVRSIPAIQEEIARRQTSAGPSAQRDSDRTREKFKILRRGSGMTGSMPHEKRRATGERDENPLVASANKGKPEMASDAAPRTAALPPVEIINPKRVAEFQPRFLLWDFDNTIWKGFPHDEEERIWAKWAFQTDTPTEDHLAQTKRFFRSAQGLNREETIRKWKTEGHPAPADFESFLPQLEEAIDRYVIEMGRCAPAYLLPGIKGLLRAIQSSGVPQKILTGGHRERRWAYAERLKVSPFLIGIHGGESKNQVVLQYADQWGANGVAVVGDGEPDMRAAKNAGALAVGFAETPARRDALVAAGADLIINGDFLSLQEILEALHLSLPASELGPTDEVVGRYLKWILSALNAQNIYTHHLKTLNKWFPREAPNGEDFAFPDEALDRWCKKLGPVGVKELFTRVDSETYRLLLLDSELEVVIHREQKGYTFYWRRPAALLWDKLPVQDMAQAPASLKRITDSLFSPAAAPVRIQFTVSNPEAKIKLPWVIKWQYRFQLSRFRWALVRYMYFHKPDTLKEIDNAISRLHGLIRQALHLTNSSRVDEDFDGYLRTGFEAAQLATLQQSDNYVADLFFPGTSREEVGRREDFLMTSKKIVRPMTLPAIRDLAVQHIDALWENKHPTLLESLFVGKLAKPFEFEGARAAFVANVDTGNAEAILLNAGFHDAGLAEQNAHEKTHLALHLQFRDVQSGSHTSGIEDWITAGVASLVVHRLDDSLEESNSRTQPFAEGIRALDQPIGRWKRRLYKRKGAAAIYRVYFSWHKWGILWTTVYGTGEYLGGLAFAAASREADALGKKDDADWIYQNAGRRFIRRLQEGPPYTLLSFLESIPKPFLDIRPPPEFSVEITQVVPQVPPDSPAGGPAAEGTAAVGYSRKLVYKQIGPVDGRNVFYIPSFPGSRLESTPNLLESLTKLGIRLTVIDLPGMGKSSPLVPSQVRYTVRSIRELADFLGIERLHLFGYSAGGPFAAACAEEFGSRLIAWGQVSPMGPMATSSDRRLNSMQTRILYRVVKHIPSLVTFYLNHVVQKRERYERFLKKQLSENDREIFSNKSVRDLIWISHREGLRQGAKQALDTLHAVFSDWGFTLNGLPWTINYLWHGKDDPRVPERVARAMAKAIPGCMAKFFPGRGHLLIIDIIYDFLDALTSPHVVMPEDLGKNSGQRAIRVEPDQQVWDVLQKLVESHKDSHQFLFKGDSLTEESALFSLELIRESGEVISLEAPFWHQTFLNRGDRLTLRLKGNDPRTENAQKSNGDRKLAASA